MVLLIGWVFHRGGLDACTACIQEGSAVKDVGLPKLQKYRSDANKAYLFNIIIKEAACFLKAIIIMKKAARKLPLGKINSYASLNPSSLILPSIELSFLNSRTLSW